MMIEWEIHHSTLALMEYGYTAWVSNFVQNRLEEIFYTYFVTWRKMTNMRYDFMKYLNTQ